MLTYFTMSSVLPRITGSAAGMGTVLADALEAARASGTAPPGETIAGLAALNCIPMTSVARVPLSGRSLLDMLV